MFKAKPTLLALAISAVLTPASLQAAVLEEVVVTATKRAESVQDVGIAITAYTGQQLEQLGFTSAQQITSMAPGVQTLQPNGEANYAVGGLVHYLTRRPDKEFSGYIKGTYGDYDQYKVEGAVGGGNDKVAARFSASYHEADGYVTNRLDKSTDLNNADDSSYRAQLLFTPTDDLEVLFNLRHGEQDIDTGFFENVSSVIPGKLTPKTFNPVLEYLDNDGDVYVGDYDDPGYNDLETDGYTATLKWAFDNFNLTTIADYSTDDGKWQATAFVDNVTDEEYLVQTFDLSGRVFSRTTYNNALQHRTGVVE